MDADKIWQQSKEVNDPSFGVKRQYLWLPCSKKTEQEKDAHPASSTMARPTESTTLPHNNPRFIDEIDLFTPSDHDDTLTTIILELRLAVVNWTFDWGAENLWDRRFNHELATARNQGRHAINTFFEKCDQHAKEGRDILRDLKFAAELRVDSTFDEIRDLFLQGYDMVLSVVGLSKYNYIKFMAIF